MSEAIAQCTHIFLLKRDPQNSRSLFLSQDLILIGDHLQLRPKLESYNLTKVSGSGFNFDVSLFERLILSNFESAMLQVQHRMHPSIADLIRHQTYPTLKDHPSVAKYPSVMGVENNLLFLDHSHPENGADEATTTKSNSFEASLCVELVRFLLLQGTFTGALPTIS